MSLPAFDNVLLERTGTDDRIGVLTLNRPEKMNALSQELIYDFRDACEYFEADDDVRVLIVKGAGRTFSAGYDLTPAGDPPIGTAAFAAAVNARALPRLKERL